MSLSKEDIVRRIISNGDTVEITLMHMPSGIRIKGDTKGSRVTLLNDLMDKLEKQVIQRG